MTITALPTPPNRANTPAEFAAAGDALLGALPQMVNEINADVATVNTKTAQAVSSAASAAASAASASAAPATASTSTTNVTIGTGTKNFTIQSGKNLVVGMFVTIAYDANNYMFGSVISYAGTALSVNVTAVVGSGTYASWAIALSAPVTPLNNVVSGEIRVLGAAKALSFFGGEGAGHASISTVGAVAHDYSTLPTWAGTHINHFGSGVAGNVSPSVPRANLGVLVFQNQANGFIGTNGAAPIYLGSNFLETIKLTSEGKIFLNGIQHDIATPNGVGSIRLLKNISGASIAGGVAVPGSGLYACYATSGGVVMPIIGGMPGTWKCVIPTGISNNDIAEFVRIV